MTAGQKNIALLVVLLSFAVSLAGFIAALLGSNHGEVASALASIIAGFVGAAGASISVYYLLTKQKLDESEAVKSAVLEEIAVITKYIIGNLSFCELVKDGIAVRRDGLRVLIVKPDPIVFRSVAGRIALLENPARIVAFYARLAEDDQIMRHIENAGTVWGHVDSIYLEKAEVKGLADLYIKQCIEAYDILVTASDQGRGSGNSIRPKMIVAIKREIESARAYWPNADAFQG